MNIVSTWILSFTVQIGARITLLLLFYLQLGLFFMNKHRLVAYSPEKCFNTFMQWAVHASKQSDENPKSSVFTETVRLPDKRSCGYQIMDWSRYTVRKYLSDEKRHAAFKSKLFKKLDLVINPLYQF